jgi:hypothetical protein
LPWPAAYREYWMRRSAALTIDREEEEDRLPDGQEKGRGEGCDHLPAGAWSPPSFYTAGARHLHQGLPPSFSTRWSLASMQS